jgi:CheY-like chemotaxis protein/predicted Ser/Thr protein kinase
VVQNKELLLEARIALVEDSDDVRNFARMLLTRKGFRVEDYPDGQEAIDAILENPPDLVISDVQMPRIDGLELTSLLRDRYSKAELPIVLVSVMSEEDDIVRGFEAGANDYIVKPYRTTELLAKVAVLLKEGPFLRRANEPALPHDDTRATPMPETIPEAGTEIEIKDAPGPSPSIAEPAPAKTESEDTEALDRAAGPIRYFFDKYEVIGEFGRGGMGTVYRAIKRDDGRLVALKVLAPRLSENRMSIARFLRETRILSEVQSPAIVRIYDHGFDGGRYFLAMEAVEGESLDKIVTRDGPLPILRAVKLFRILAGALVALAEARLVHRDVKPANLIVSENDQIKLVDFGLAKHQKREMELSESGYTLGTPYYIAPEIIEGKSASPQSDLFAAGVSLFEVLTKRRPFPGTVPYQVFRQIVSGKRPDPREFRPEIDEDLAGIIGRLLARDLSARTRSALELEAELATWLQNHGQDSPKAASGPES